MSVATPPVAIIMGSQSDWATMRRAAVILDELGVAYPFGPGHLNVKTLLAIALGLKKGVGMSKGLAALGLPLEGTHHRAGDDAWNIAAILAALLRRARQPIDP